MRLAHNPVSTTSPQTIALVIASLLSGFHRFRFAPICRYFPTHEGSRLTYRIARTCPRVTRVAGRQSDTAVNAFRHRARTRAVALTSVCQLSP